MNDKVIKVFVSSTFNDMHRERDLLRSIEGLINKDIASSGYSVQIVDLRYGIDTSGEQDEIAAERKVLKKCFSAINDCQIFMLILGDRYGTVFDDIDMSAIPLDDQEAKGKSVTHLEFMYGNKVISKENILIFIRNIEYAGERQPHHEEIENIKKKVVESGTRIDYYNATFEDGKYRIDEYYFYKHALGFLETMVQEYIASLSNKEEATTLIHFEKDRNKELQTLIQEKAMKQAPETRDAYEKLLWLRVGDLLNEQDYTKIKEGGGTGRTQLEYRKKILLESPDPIDKLLHVMCNLIGSVLGEGDEDEIYQTLCLIAYAQKHMASTTGVLTTKEMACLFEQTDSEIHYVYDEYIENKLEDSGIYHKPASTSKALSYFVECQILNQDENGYFFHSDAFAEYLAEQCSKVSRNAIKAYHSKIWWFLPGRMQKLLSFLSDGDYERFYESVKYLWYAKEITEKIKSHLEMNFNELELRDVIRNYLYWCVKTDKPARDMIYILCCLYHPNADDIYEEYWVPLCEEIYEVYKSEKEHNLVNRFVANYLYEQFSVEQESPQSNFMRPEEIEEIENLNDALWELFFYHESSDDDGIEEMEAHFSEWDQVCDVLQIMKLTHGGHGYIVLMNLLDAFLKGKLSSDDYKYLVRKMIRTAYSYDELMDDMGQGISCIMEYLIGPLNKSGYYEIGLWTFHELCFVIRLEEFVRCCIWTQWNWYMQLEILDELYTNTKDPIVLDTLKVLEDNYFFEREELEELDKSILNGRTVIED